MVRVSMTKKIVV